jgi:hypothetical protein
VSGAVLILPSRMMNRFSPDPSAQKPSVSSMIASS